MINSKPEKAYDKIQHLFMMKILKKLGIKGMNINIIAAVYEKCIDRKEERKGGRKQAGREGRKKKEKPSPMDGRSKIAIFRLYDLNM